MFYNGQGEQIETGTASALNGKKWLPFGDSISVTSGYTWVIKHENNMSTIDGGCLGGRQIAYGAGSDNCVLSFLDSLSAGTPDIITIALGTNDYGNNTPIGTVSDDPSTQDANSYTFIGCYKKLIESLYTKYGKLIPMLLVTPFPRNAGGIANSAGKTVADYAQAIKEVGLYYSIPVCDMLSESGIPVGTLFDSNANNFKYTPDGLHLMRSGSAIFCPKIAAYMEYAIKRYDVLCESLGASGESYTISAGNDQMIYVLLHPDATTELVEWTSSDESVVTVEGNINYIYATITGVAAGTATVTATCGTVTKEFSITVT